MFLGAVIGIDTQGRYVVVHNQNGSPFVVNLRADELSGVGSVHLRDMVMDINKDSHLSKRFIRSSLSSYEDNLLLIDSANIIDSAREDDAFVAYVDVVGFTVSYSEFLADSEKTLEFFNEEIRVKLKEVKDEWVSAE